MAAPRKNENQEHLPIAALSPSESRMHVHNFSDALLTTTVHFLVIKMQESFFIWMGTKGNFDNLAVSMKTKYVSSVCARTSHLSVY